MANEQIKLKCCEIAFITGSKVGITKTECIEVAKKIYSFVVGQEDSPQKRDK